MKDHLLDKGHSKIQPEQNNKCCYHSSTFGHHGNTCSCKYPTANGAWAFSTIVAAVTTTAHWKTASVQTELYDRRIERRHVSTALDWKSEADWNWDREADLVAESSATELYKRRVVPSVTILINGSEIETTG